jgi:hypothetical protein
MLLRDDGLDTHVRGCHKKRDASCWYLAGARAGIGMAGVECCGRRGQYASSLQRRCPNWKPTGTFASPEAGSIEVYLPAAFSG